MSKNIDNKLQDYTDSLEKRLKEIKELQRSNDGALESNFEGKKLFYVDQERNPILREKVRITMDDTAVFKHKEIPKFKENNSQNKDSTHTLNKGSDNTDEVKKLLPLCWYDLKCRNVSCSYRHSRPACKLWRDCKNSSCNKRHLPPFLQANNRNNHNSHDREENLRRASPTVLLNTGKRTYNNPQWEGLGQYGYLANQLKPRLAPFSGGTIVQPPFHPYWNPNAQFNYP